MVEVVAACSVGSVRESAADEEDAGNNICANAGACDGAICANMGACDGANAAGHGLTIITFRVSALT